MMMTDMAEEIADHVEWLIEHADHIAAVSARGEDITLVKRLRRCGELLAALAQQPQGEAVAWANLREDGTVVAISQHPEDIARWLNPIPLYAAPPQAAPVAQAEADLAAIYDAFGIGKEARTLSVLLTNLRNMKHFTELLWAVEREFFMVPGEPSDELEDEGCEPNDECLVNCWGSTKEQYIEQFRAALAAKAAAPVAQGLPDDDMRRLHDKSQMGWGHDWLKFGRLVEASILAQSAPSASARQAEPPTHLQKWAQVIDHLPVSRDTAPAPASPAEYIKQLEKETSFAKTTLEATREAASGRNKGASPVALTDEQIAGIRALWLDPAKCDEEHALSYNSALEDALDALLAASPAKEISHG